MSSRMLSEHTEKLFRQWKDGDQDVIVEILELERPTIFDYSFRMSGQREGSLKILDEVISTLKEESTDAIDEYEQLRVKLFATFRSFASHIWNADTSQLVNEGYEQFDQEGLPNRISDGLVRKVETSLAALPGWEKEPLILAVRCGFTYEQVAEITSNSLASTEGGINHAYIKMAQVCQIEPDLIDTAVAAIPAHPLTRGAMHSTAALSQIMGDIERSRGKLSKLKVALGILILILALSAGAYIGMNYQELVP